MFSFDFNFSTEQLYQMIDAIFMHDCGWSSPSRCGITNKIVVGIRFANGSKWVVGVWCVSYIYVTSESEELSWTNQPSIT